MLRSRQRVSGPLWGCQRGAGVYYPHYMHRTGMDHPYPLKTIDVPIYPHARGWHDFFEHRALNWPGRYHNGGIWPMIGGFYVAALVFRKRQREAEAALV